MAATHKTLAVSDSVSDFAAELAEIHVKGPI
jgi:hypothetical protein